MVGCVIPSFEQYRYLRELRKQHRQQKRLLKIKQEQEEDRRRHAQQQKILTKTVVEKEKQSRSKASNWVSTETNEDLVADSPSLDSCSSATILSTTSTTQSSSTESYQGNRRRTSSTRWLSKSVFTTKIAKATQPTHQSQESSSWRRKGKEKMKKSSFDEIVDETDKNQLSNRIAFYPALQLEEITKSRISISENQNVQSRQNSLKCPTRSPQNPTTTTAAAAASGVIRKSSKNVQGRYLSWKSSIADMSDSDGTLSPSPKKKQRTNGHGDEDTFSSSSSRRRLLPNGKRRRKLQQSKLSFTPLK